MPEITVQDNGERQNQSPGTPASRRYAHAVVPRLATESGCAQPTPDRQGPSRRLCHASRRAVWRAAWRQWLGQEAM